MQTNVHISRRKKNCWTLSRISRSKKEEKDLAVIIKNQLTLFTWGAEKKITNEAHIGCWTEKEFFCVEIFISPNKDRDIHQEKGGYGISYKGAKTGNVRVKPDIPPNI